MTYYFDMDGTIADLYAVNKWKEYLNNEDVLPYIVCKPLINLAKLARRIHKVQREGHKVVIITWTAKEGTIEYNARVAEAKAQWLANHLPTVEWDDIKIVPYGTDKKAVCGDGILFDNEENNRANWGAGAYLPQEIFEIMT